MLFGVKRALDSFSSTIEHVYRKEALMAQAVGKFDYKLQPFPYGGFSFFLFLGRVQSTVGMVSLSNFKLP